MNTLVFATNNAHKLGEVRQILGGSFEVLGLKDIGCEADIPETADTFEGNAWQKARYVKEHFGYDCMADDSGLEVDALGGEPGVHSARYAATADGQGHDSEANIDLLLAKMQAFDEQGYVTLSEKIYNGWHRYDNIDDSIQLEQQKLYEMQLDQMTEVLNANERIFLFLEKLGMELQGMNSEKENQATIDLLNEIQHLIGDVKYYS